MLKYIVKRILLSVIILFGVSLIIYVLVRIKPGDNFVRTKYSPQLLEDSTGDVEKKVEQIEETYGLAEPGYRCLTIGCEHLVKQDDYKEGYQCPVCGGTEFKPYGVPTNPFVGYWKWLGNVLSGDWGESFIFSVDTGKYDYYYQISENGVVTEMIPYSGKSDELPAYIDEIPGKNDITQYVMEKDAEGNVTKFYTCVKQALSSAKVVDVILSKCKISFVISLIATILEFLIAIPLGIVSATKQYGVVDYTVTVLAMMGISLPTFFLGALLLKIFSIDLGWFPYAGLIDPNSGLPTFVDMLWHLVLPMVTLVILSIGGLMRYTRTNMLEVLNADYIRTARAKGLSEHSVIYKHAFRNSLIPIVTMLAGILPGLFGGAMITETVFSIDGIGKAAYKAVVQGDIPLIMAYNMFISLLTVIGTLFSDLMYAVVDPRVKLTD